MRQTWRLRRHLPQPLGYLALPARQKGGFSGRFGTVLWKLHHMEAALQQVESELQGYNSFPTPDRLQKIIQQAAQFRTLTQTTKPTPEQTARLKVNWTDLSGNPRQD